MEEKKRDPKEIILKANGKMQMQELSRLARVYKLRAPQSDPNNLLERISQDISTIKMFDKASKSALRKGDKKAVNAMSRSADYCLIELKLLTMKNSDAIKQEVRIMEGHMMLRGHFHVGMNIITTDVQRKIIAEALAHMRS